MGAKLLLSDLGPRPSDLRPWTSEPQLELLTHLQIWDRTIMRHSARTLKPSPTPSNPTPDSELTPILTPTSVGWTSDP